MFQRAHAIAPSARTLGQMGLVEGTLEHWTDAEDHLTAALAAADDSWIRKNKANLQTALDSVKPHIGQLVFSGTPAPLSPSPVRSPARSRTSLPFGSPQEPCSSAPRLPGVSSSSTAHRAGRHADSRHYQPSTRRADAASVFAHSIRGDRCADHSRAPPALLLENLDGRRPPGRGRCRPDMGNCLDRRRR